MKINLGQRQACLTRLPWLPPILSIARAGNLWILRVQMPPYAATVLPCWITYNVIGVFVAGWLSAAQAMDDTSARDMLLDEVVAGVDANLVALQHGVATYTATETRFFQSASLTGGTPKAGEGRPITYRETVYFNYPRIRVESEGAGRLLGQEEMVTKEILVYDGQRRLKYLVPHIRPDGQSVPANIHHAYVEPIRKNDMARFPHPRRQLMERPGPQERLRRMRRNRAALLVASREPSGLIYVKFEPEQGAYRAELWFSPSQGYSLVRAKEWSLSISVKEPGTVYEAAVRKASADAFVIEQRREQSLIAVDGVFRPNRETLVTLEQIDLDTVPDESLFRLDGLGLPAGATIRDKAAGRDYAYALADVDEKKVVVPKASGASPLGHWVFAAYVAAGFSLLMLGFWWQRRRLRRR